MGQIEILKSTAAPTAPASGRVTLFVDARDRLQALNSAGRLVGVRDGEAASASTVALATETLFQVAIPEDSLIVLWGYVWGVNDTIGAGASRRLHVVARRVGTGAAVIVGNDNGALITDASPAPAIAVDIDTVTESLRVRVTGVAAQDWEWRGRLVVEGIP